ncbi:LPXTG cell wall anchor domain-containing protein [Nocardioides sp. NPDC047086]|uniref:LPXTG cell wall anchor domain-containing protein n=1 Tax=Nocardioides sp. NPDC047086 TaxID=3154810 RepID=UPI0033E4DD5B
MRAVRLLLALLVISSLAAAAPAAASTEPVQLSNDGRTWGVDLPRPLFEPEVRWVPGDSREATFWVRDAGESRGALTVSADIRDADGLVAEGAMSLRLRRGDGRWQEVRPGDRASLGWLERGSQDRIGVIATYAPASGNDTMDRSLTFSLDVRLTGEDATGPGGATPPGGNGNGDGNGDGEGAGDGGLLPDTGSPVTWSLIALASLLIGGGTALVLRSKRKGRS